MSPKQVAESVVKISKKKARLPLIPLLILGILAGVYIGFGAQLYTTVTHDLAKHLGLGFAHFLGGSVFSLGLILVVIDGAELFTGNCLMIAAVLNKKISLLKMLRNWFFVYLANFVGAMLLVLIMFYSGLWKLGNFGVGASALTIAFDKINLSFLEAFARGIGGNWLVCLAVWMAIAAKNPLGQILGIYFPIMAFVASGFEHSIANMYFVPIGLLLKNNVAIVYLADLVDRINRLTWSAFFINNLLPVTLGNIVGGALFVGGAYYLAYLRKSKKD